MIKIKNFLGVNRNVLIIIGLFVLFTLMTTLGYCSGNDEVQNKLHEIFEWMQEIAYILAGIVAIFSMLKLIATKDWSEVVAPLGGAIGIGIIGLLIKFIQGIFTK